MKIFAVYAALSFAAFVLVSQFIVTGRTEVASTLRLQKDFWVVNTSGINTPDRGEMSTCLVSFKHRNFVEMTDCQGHVFRRLGVKHNIVDFNMKAPMTVVVRQDWWTGKLSVYPITVI